MEQKLQDEWDFYAKYNIPTIKETLDKCFDSNKNIKVLHRDIRDEGKSVYYLLTGESEAITVEVLITLTRVGNRYPRDSDYELKVTSYDVKDKEVINVICESQINAELGSRNFNDVGYKFWMRLRQLVNFTSDVKYLLYMDLVGDQNHCKWCYEYRREPGQIDRTSNKEFATPFTMEEVMDLVKYKDELFSVVNFRAERHKFPLSLYPDLPLE